MNSRTHGRLIRAAIACLPIILLVCPNVQTQEKDQVKKLQTRPSTKTKLPFSRQIKRLVHLRETYPSSWIPEKSPTPEEEAFVQALAEKLGYATAVVAADPTQSYPRGSVAEKLRASFLRIDANKRTVMSQRARSLLNESVIEKQNHFGRFAETGSIALEQNPKSFLDPELRALLQDAVQARLNAQRPELISAIQQLNKDIAQVPKTWVEAGFFQKDVQSTGKKEITLNRPQSLDFRWGTAEKDAEQGYWQLTRPGQVLMPTKVLASGAAGPPGSVFSIDLTKYLPAEAPKMQKYHVRVVPQRARNLTLVPGIHPGSSKKAKLSLEVGPWSRPVIITYAQSTTPPQVFEMPDVYRYASLYLDKIDMVEDQIGAGSEEFYVMGFVQESWLTTIEEMGKPKIVMRTGKREKFGPLFKELCPDVDEKCSEAEFGQQVALFQLNNPDQAEWPRSFTYVLSVMEADGGAELAEWQSDLWDISDSVLEGEIADMVEEYLDSLIEEALQGVNIGAQVVQTIISAISSATAGYIAAAVAGAAITIFAILNEMEDDFYGVSSHALALDNNLSDFIHAFQGEQIGSRYRLKHSNWSFYGPPLKGIAGGWDGEVDIYFHWEFGRREPYTGGAISKK